ncbi:thiol-disulfide oxidoreductase LTO1 isoform X2 [Momordica charantia]|uniref:Thiol-disulfide oxidoreductase LTO1 isoform X2 n=1 Tax=Momordica charantia TaxID=3673 RepID=A0A6J1BUY0_MOMCH|nr:thiol-disulfide oxidoreductase LTO1 isoform X2 [Momordica charantia]
MACSTSAALLSLPLSFQRPSPRQFLSLFHHRYDSFNYPKFWVQRRLLVPVFCLSGGTNQDTEPEADTTPLDSSSSFSPSISSNSTYNLCAALGGIGFVETAYLSYLKLANAAAFCPIGGGSCDDVLNSEYAAVFGVPLPLIGMVAYGLVGAISLQLAAKKLPFGIDESDGRLVLLGTTTSMAAASAYFLYVLSSKFSGVSCSYCLISALLSSSLFFATVKEFGFQEITSAAELDLPYYQVEIAKPSSPLAISLARHLQSIGAKMYGAFWCSHCLEQKEMFGREAAKILDYVECFPNGYHKGTKIEKACTEAGIEGFPSWVINGQVLSGEKELSELAEISGFELDGIS